MMWELIFSHNYIWELGIFLIGFMGDGRDEKKTVKTSEIQSLPVNILPRMFSRDLLQTFNVTSGVHQGSKDKDEETELNLDLSLGGNFGVDSSSPHKLTRSSSIACYLPVVRDDNDAQELAPLPAKVLVRTSSLPVETEEEWSKRKELQSLRRMEAKRRRSEKQRNIKASGEAQSAVGSSSLSDADSRNLQGSSDELLSANLQSLLEGDIGTSGVQSRQQMSIATPSNRIDPTRTIGKETGMNPTEDMPSVYTTGDAPNGRRVDGILYKYGKGEEVRIMCICHGNFYSPAEFIRHAGGTKVDNPLKHIVMNSHPSLL